MATIPGEIVDAVVAFLQTPTVQDKLTNIIANGEVEAEHIVDAVIAHANVGGPLELVLNALKGSAEAEIHAEFAKIPAPALAKLLTTFAQNEATALGG
jgi:hypothetical protein